MKVSGFTFIRNAVLFDFPIAEAIQSILPLCDEVVVAVGRSDDNTLELVKSIGSPKLKIIETVWDDTLRGGGKVLAAETMKAKEAVSPDSDWLIYIQGDEVLHEQYLPALRQAMEQWKNDEKTEGLLLKYHHFWGSYAYVADAYNWYRNEIRVIRNRPDIISWKDAQGFRKSDGTKLQVRKVDACIHHYGWVKPPAAQLKKREAFLKLWHNQNIPEQEKQGEGYNYQLIDSLKKFEGTHPACMQARIKACNWMFNYDTSKSKLKWKYRLRQWIEKHLGISIGEYRNYRLLKQ